MSGPAKLRMTWSGRPLAVGVFLKTPNGRTAYEITAIKPSKPKYGRIGIAGGGKTFNLTCHRWQPSEVPEGATVLPFRWDPR